MNEPNDAQRIDRLQAEVIAIRHTLATALAWIAQSDASPLSMADVKTLLRQLDGPEADGEGR